MANITDVTSLRINGKKIIKVIKGAGQGSPIWDVPADGPSVLCPYIFTSNVGAQFTGDVAYTTFAQTTVGVYTATLDQQDSAGANVNASSVTAEDATGIAPVIGGSEAGNIGYTVPLDGTNIIGWEVELTGADLLGLSVSAESVSVGLWASAGYYDFPNSQGNSASVQVGASLNPATGIWRTFSTASWSDLASGQNGFANQTNANSDDDVDGSQIIGLYYNQNTRQIGMVTTQGDMGYLPVTDSGDFVGQEVMSLLSETATDLGIAARTQVQKSADASVGTVTTTIRSVSSQIKLPFPAGTVDPCLNAMQKSIIRYPFDMPEATISAVTGGASVRMDEPQLFEQKFSMTIDDGSTGKNPIAAPDVIANPSRTIDVSGKRVAWEWDVDLTDWAFTPEGAGGVGDIANTRISIVRSANFQGQNLGMFTLYDDGDIEMILSDYQVKAKGTVAPGRYRITCLFDDVSGILRAWMDGVELIPGTTPTPSAVDWTSALLVMDSQQINGTDENGAAGSKSITRVITDPYWMKHADVLPAGTLAVDLTTVLN